MNFNNPLPRHLGPRFHEASRQRPQRDSDSVTQAWKKTKASQVQAAALVNSVQLLQRQVNSMRKRKGGGDNETVRLFLCDSITGQGSYYLVAAELDADQTPAGD